MRPRLALLALTLAATGAARDHEFDALVRSVEAHYQVRHTRIPMLGVVNFFVKAARPAGTTDLKLAVFEHTSLGGREREFHDVVGAALGPQWRPFVRVRSPRESNEIYSRVDEKRWQLLIASLERDEVSLVRLRLNVRALKR